MANYSASLTADLAVGEVQVVSNAALTTPFDTQAVAIGREQGPAELVVYNLSSQTATVYASHEDVAASYQALKVDGTAVTVTSTTTGQFRCAARFVRLRMAADPGTSVVAIGR